MLRACLRSANATAPVRRTRCCHLSTLLAASLGERCGVCEYVANGKASYKNKNVFFILDCLGNNGPGQVCSK